MLNYSIWMILKKKKQVQFNLTEVVDKTDFCIDKTIIKWSPKTDGIKMAFGM